MGFRDEVQEERWRAEAAERRVAALEAENATLRGGPPVATPTTDPARRGRVQAILYIGSMVALTGGAAVAAYLLGAPEIAALVGVLGFSLLIGGALTISLAERPPDGFALVLSGRRYPGPGGSTVGYRVVVDRHVIRVPILERSDLLDCRRRTTELRIPGAYCKDNTPLTIEAEATIALAGREPEVGRAIERFLGRTTDEVDRVARETLEGKLRESLAGRTEAEVRGDREAFAMQVIEDAEPDMAKLGIELVELHVTNVRS